MSFSASHIEITLRYTFLGQNCQTARVYTWDGVAIATASPAALGEAWWNHYSAAWRGLAADGSTGSVFNSVFVREVGGGLAFGEYAIPVLEQLGTRDVSALGSYIPSGNAVGVRLTVGTGATRPGQMRVPFLCDGDVSANDVSGDFQELASELADLYSQPNTLGAPTATGVITPVVPRFGADNNTITASQPIVGFLVNPLSTTQVSRRAGHGS